MSKFTSIDNGKVSGIYNLTENGIETPFYASPFVHPKLKYTLTEKYYLPNGSEYLSSPRPETLVDRAIKGYEKFLEFRKKLKDFGAPILEEVTEEEPNLLFQVPNDRIRPDSNWNTNKVINLEYHNSIRAVPLYSLDFLKHVMDEYKFIVKHGLQIGRNQVAGKCFYSPLFVYSLCEDTVNNPFPGRVDTYAQVIENSQVGKKENYTSEETLFLLNKIYEHIIKKGNEFGVNINVNNFFDIMVIINYIRLDFSIFPKNVLLNKETAYPVNNYWELIFEAIQTLPLKHILVWLSALTLDRDAIKGEHKPVISLDEMLSVSDAPAAYVREALYFPSMDTNKEYVF